MGDDDHEPRTTNHDHDYEGAGGAGTCRSAWRLAAWSVWTTQHFERQMSEIHDSQIIPHTTPPSSTSSAASTTSSICICARGALARQKNKTKQNVHSAHEILHSIYCQVNPATTTSNPPTCSERRKTKNRKAVFFSFSFLNPQSSIFNLNPQIDVSAGR
jgi:hypothetical protein